jgi:hypothetical protein
MKKIILFNIVIIIASSIFTNEIILTDDVIYNSLGDQLSNDQIKSILGMSKQMAWLEYILAVVGYLLKLIVISALVYLILILNEIEVLYSDTVAIVAMSFTVFLLPIFIKILVLSFSTSPISLDALQFFSIGSLLNVFDSDGMENWLKVILRSINIWEVIFMVVLAFQLRKYFNNDLKTSISNVILSYGGGLMVWTFFVVFITITLSQN